MNSLQHTVILLAFVLESIISVGQTTWQNADMEKDSLFGISVDKAYSELLTGKKSVRVIVAVIDGGIDTAHEDLRQALWVNKKEIPGNGKDDDRNGYVDDIHGWNFIGGKKENVRDDNLEITRIIRAEGSFFDSLSYGLVPITYRSAYQEYRKLKSSYEAQLTAAQTTMGTFEELKKVLVVIVAKIGKPSPGISDFENYTASDDLEKSCTNAVLSQLRKGITYDAYMKRIDSVYEQFRLKEKYQLNPDYDPRNIVGDDYRNFSNRHYGNSDVFGPYADHGTHVAGIIGGVRNNHVGLQGVADNVLLMPIRVVPNGDERDKDVANAIRYATDNGAKIINMSFGKKYSPDKVLVDEAVQYAMNKDVLVIHGAGNDGANLDAPGNDFFPSCIYANSQGKANAWIEVGATGREDNEGLVARFSNYGKKKVDVFAPGVDIYSTVPHAKYAFMSGTSMAAPVVSGLAALIRGYYPKLNAVQVKEIILCSVVKRPVLADKCVSGGVVNAYNALRLAATY